MREAELQPTVEKAGGLSGLEYRTCCDHPDCTTCKGHGGFYRMTTPAAHSPTAADAAVLSSEVIGYRIENRPGDYSWQSAKHWEHNNTFYSRCRVHELHLGRMIQNPGVDIEVAAVFPSMWSGVRPDDRPAAVMAGRRTMGAAVYENGPEGMPRVERMPYAVLDCIIEHSLFRWIGNGLMGEDRDRLHGLMHDTAEEVLARVAAWPDRTAAMGAAGQVKTDLVVETFKELVSKNTHRRPRIVGNDAEYRNEIDTFQIGRDAIDIAYGKAARPTASGAVVRDDFARGYFCATSVLLRETGHADTDVRSLFGQGGDPTKADASDIELFREHGLMPKGGA